MKINNEVNSLIDKWNDGLVLVTCMYMCSNVDYRHNNQMGVLIRASSTWLRHNDNKNNNNNNHDSTTGVDRPLTKQQLGEPDGPFDTSVNMHLCIVSLVSFHEPVMTAMGPAHKTLQQQQPS